MYLYIHVYIYIYIYIYIYAHIQMFRGEIPPFWGVPDTTNAFGLLRSQILLHITDVTLGLQTVENVAKYDI